MSPSNQLIEDHILTDYGFELPEAYQLLNHTVAELSRNLTDPAISDLGLVCGILTVNDEIELVVKFMTELRQYTKTEFSAQLKVIKD